MIWETDFEMSIENTIKHFDIVITLDKATKTMQPVSR